MLWLIGVYVPACESGNTVMLKCRWIVTIFIFMQDFSPVSILWFWLWKGWGKEILIVTFHPVYYRTSWADRDIRGLFYGSVASPTWVLFNNIVPENFRNLLQPSTHWNYIRSKNKNKSVQIFIKCGGISC